MTPLQMARTLRGLSQQQVANAVGTTKGHYSRIERGEHAPRPELAQRLAEFFGISELQVLYPQRYVLKAELEKAS